MAREKTAEKDLVGRNVLVTGANTGIGRVTAETLAARGADVVLACRSEDRTAPIVAGIVAAGGKARFEKLDLGDFASVRACAERLLAKGDPIHVLVNNAGLAGQRGLTKDGYELIFGTNHLGHFLFTVLLAPLLKKGATKETPARIVNVASKVHMNAKGIDYDVLKRSTPTITGMDEYAVSKLANILFTKECARLLGPEGIHNYALHPGVVGSDVWRAVPWGLRSLLKLFMLTNEEGARTTLYCATSPEVEAHDGRYYDECKERTPSAYAQDEKLAKELWEKSVAMTGADL